MSLKYRRTASLNLTALGWHTTLSGKEFQSIIVLDKVGWWVCIRLKKGKCWSLKFVFANPLSTVHSEKKGKLNKNQKEKHVCHASLPHGNPKVYSESW